MFRNVSILAWLTMLLVSPTPVRWESRLFPNDAQAGKHVRRTVEHAGRRWRLPDTSFTGYRLGEESPGSGIPCKITTVTGSGDIAATLQQAIAALEATGGGVVRLPEGEFTLGRSVAIRRGGISIVGAGSDRTVLRIPASYSPSDPRYEGVFTFGKPLGGWHKAWLDRGEVVTSVVEVIPDDSRLVVVEDPSALRVGDWIVVRQYFNAAFASRNSARVSAWPSFDGWPDPTTEADRRFSFSYLRRISTIDGSTIELDAPIPWELDPEENPIRIQSATRPSWIAPIANVGLSGVTIAFDDNRRGPGGRPVGTGVYFEGVRDGWVHGVRIRNIPRFGVYMDHSARISVIDTAVQDAQDYGEDGWGYAFHTESSQNVLFRRCYSEEVRHGFTIQYPLSSSVVMSECESAAARAGGDDSHHSLTHGVVWDRHVMTHGTGLFGVMRGATSGGAYETTGSAIVWNVDGDGCLGGWYGGSVQLNPASDGWGIVVGGPGRHSVWDANVSLGRGSRMAAFPGLQVAPARDGPGLGRQDGNVLYEGLYRPDLAPASLYRAQLAGRLGREPAAFASGCVEVAPAAAVERSTRAGPESLVFDSDHLGWVAHRGGGANAFDPDATEFNATPEGRESLRLSLAPADWAIGATFRGCVVETTAFRDLEFRIRPSAADLRVRIGLRLQSLPAWTETSLGDVIVGEGLEPGTWNSVTIPLNRFSPGSFNAIQIRSLGAESASPFHLDEIRLAPVH